MRKRLLLVLALTLVISTLLSFERTFAQQRSVGVSVGSSGKAEFVYSGNGTLPPLHQMFQWTEATVQEISGTNITFEQVDHFADGHEVTTTRFIDVDTGVGNASGSFIAANLSAGDLIYTSPPNPTFIGATINETIIRDVLGVSVEVNHYNWTDTVTIPGNGTHVAIFNGYWQRTTGIAVEVSRYYSFKPEFGALVWSEVVMQIDSMSEVFSVVVESVDYSVIVDSNCTITNFAFNQTVNEISFNATGHEGEIVFCNVTIPNDLLWGEFIVLVNGSPQTVTRTESGNQISLYFSFELQSSMMVQILGQYAVPEFPPAIFVALFMIATMLAVIFPRKTRVPPII